MFWIVANTSCISSRSSARPRITTRSVIGERSTTSSATVASRPSTSPACAASRKRRVVALAAASAASAPAPTPAPSPSTRGASAARSGGLSGVRHLLLAGLPGCRASRMAVAPEDLLHPAIAGPVAHGGAEAFVWLGHLIDDRRRLRREHDRVQEGGRGEVGDREAPVGQVIAALELRLEALEAGNDLHSRVLGRLCAARSVAKRHERAAVIQHHASQPRELWRHPGCDL